MPAAIIAFRKADGVYEFLIRGMVYGAGKIQCLPAKYEQS